MCNHKQTFWYREKPTEKVSSQVSFNGGVPITEEFFMEKIHGKHNDQLCGILFPDWDFERAIKFMNNKEAMFRR